MIDVSSWQGRVKWKLCYRDGVRRAGIKLTEGSSIVDRIVDPFAEVNLRNARAAGVDVFCYHFAHPSNPPLQEAHHFLATARRLGAIRPGDIVPHVDLEVDEGRSVEQLRRWLASFCGTVDGAVGVEDGCGVYSDAFMLEELGVGLRPVWGADYRSLGWQPPPHWWAWQHSCTGRVAGVRGDVDLSVVRHEPRRAARAV